MVDSPILIPGPSSSRSETFFGFLKRSSSLFRLSEKAAELLSPAAALDRRSSSIGSLSTVSREIPCWVTPITPTSSFMRRATMRWWLPRWHDSSTSRISPFLPGLESIRPCRRLRPRMDTTANSSTKANPKRICTARLPTPMLSEGVFSGIFPPAGFAFSVRSISFWSLRNLSSMAGDGGGGRSACGASAMVSA